MFPVPVTTWSYGRHLARLFAHRFSIKCGAFTMQIQYDAFSVTILRHRYLFYMVRLKGLEPLTYGLEGRCSIQLSYRRIGMIEQ